MTSIEEAICKLDDRLKAVPRRFAFLGGSLLSLLVTDKTVDTIRVTKDIDVMMDIRSRKDYHEVDAMLERLGFRHDTREDAPICRWICEDVTVDVLPIHVDVLGWNSKWFDVALEESSEVRVGDRVVRIVSAPFFVALKVEAFEERGKGDFISSTDFEDIICLFNGREAVVDEIASSERLRGFLAGKFAAYLDQPECEDAVEGFVQTEDDPDWRKRLVLGRFKAVADLMAISDSTS